MMTLIYILALIGFLSIALFAWVIVEEEFFSKPHPDPIISLDKDFIDSFVETAKEMESHLQTLPADVAGFYRRAFYATLNGQLYEPVKRAIEGMSK
ncbi:TPA: hypothetical protein JG946_003742 [Enterobacter hormaechei subsp. steigerwaltii]|nr:hypothetical protein [Enterobacter hormaechei subsp. steigerwaltii]